MRIITSHEMRQLEETAISAGCPVEQLMDRAAQGIATVVLTLLRPAQYRRVLVVAGPGNNGGDALLAGQFLASAGCEVDMWTWSRTRPAPPFVTLPIRPVNEAGLPSFCDSADRATLLLDGLLGIGRNRPVDGLLRQILQAVRGVSGRCTVVAVDVPTGVDADTGQADVESVHADLTVTLGLAKAGLFMQPAAEYVGRVVVAPLGLPIHALDTVQGVEIDAVYVAARLPQRLPDSNKGTYGKVLVAAGSEKYLGAPILAALAACRAGAGLVTLAVARNVYDLLAGHLPEVTFEPLPGEGGGIGPASVAPLLDAAMRYTVCVLGPGLGQSSYTRDAVLEVCSTLRGRASAPHLVVDADGLNALAGVDHWWEHVPEHSIITPHPGEMGRLTGTSAGDVQEDRVRIARDAAAKWKLVVVLKGASTIVAAPDGRYAINPVAVPALATAGTGDVLAGTIGALLAQGLASFDAACCGVFVHAAAGLLIEEESGTSGLLATELADHLPRALMQVRSR